MDKFENVTTGMLIDIAKRNMYQLMVIGIVNSDEAIKETYGGERALLELIKGYFCLTEDLTALWEREHKDDRN
jgi:hypothetical protein